MYKYVFLSFFWSGRSQFHIHRLNQKAPKTTQTQQYQSIKNPPYPSFVSLKK
jgi:hypothetical protein